MPHLLLTLVVLCTPLIGPLPSACARQQGEGVEASVVKIYSSVRAPNPMLPWAPGRPAETTGTGVVIDGERILTCGHVVAYASEVLIESSQLRRRVPARVVSIARDMDIAVLAVDEPGFFENHAPVKFHEGLPSARDQVTVYGYPKGGDTLSISQGVVSRIEFESFYYGAKGFRIQIDAAVNPGNSGGPALINDEMVGIVFSQIREGENIGYLIASEEIKLVLEDVADGVYDGKARLRIDWGTTEYDALRAWLGLPDDVSGAIVVGPHPVSPGFPVRENDVIVAVESYDVDDRGMVRLEGGMPIGLEAVVQRLQHEDSIGLTLWRDGDLLEVSVPLESEDHRLIPFEDGMSEPSYIIYGPLVLSPVDGYLASMLERSDRMRDLLLHIQSPVISRRNDFQRWPGEELVMVVCPPLKHEASRGMPPSYAHIVTRVNGVQISSFPHLVEALRDLDGEFAVFGFDEHWTGKMIVRASDVDTVTDEILRDNGIRERMSEDARQIWDAGE